MSYEKIGQTIGKLVQEKNIAYGDSHAVTGEILALMTQSLTLDQLRMAMPDLLTIARVLDKVMRILHQPEAFGESPWQDIAGYAILKVKEWEEDT